MSTPSQAQLPDRPPAPGAPPARPRLAAVAPLFLAAAPFLLLSNGRVIVPAAAWIGPALLVRALRDAPTPAGFAAAYAVALAVRFTQWWGLVPLPRPVYFGVGAALELAALLPYVADARLARRLGALPATLVLPACWVTAEFVQARLGPYGGWGSVAYSQYGALPLMQLASVTGTAGITFLIAWWAATANTWWERRAGGLRAAAAFAGVLAAVLVLGGLRLALAPGDGPTARVAGVVPSVERDDPAEGPALAAELLERSAREARAGAEVVAWPEGSVTLSRDDEAALLERAGGVARREGCYLALAYYAREDGSGGRYENVATLVDPSGAVAWRYLKASPIPGRGEQRMVRGRTPAPAVATPRGRLATLICYDCDHPELVARASAGADLLLVPANDWKAIDPLHTRMAVFRAVESGVSLVRVTLNGLSIATDPFGIPLASCDSFETPGCAMSAPVPAARVGTMYALVGDLFSWAAVAAAALLVGAAWRAGRGSAAGGPAG